MYYIISYLKCNNRTISFIETVLKTSQDKEINSEQKYWNIIIRINKIISIYYLDIKIFCNGEEFYIKGKRHFFDDLNGIIN